MRSRAGRAALALAALALGAAGCSDLVSSLTPFGVGDRKPDQNEVAYSGNWSGTTTSGGIVAFPVAGGLVGPLLLQHVTETCTLSFETGDGVTAPIDADAFSFDLELDPQGRIVIEGTFTTTDSVSGRYFFEGRATISGCPTSGGGDFAAAKLTQP